MDPDTGVWMVEHDDGSFSFSVILMVHGNLLNGLLLLIKDKSVCLKDFILQKENV